MTSLPTADKAEDQAKKIVGEFVTAVRCWLIAMSSLKVTARPLQSAEPAG